MITRLVTVSLGKDTRVSDQKDTVVCQERKRFLFGQSRDGKSYWHRINHPTVRILVGVRSLTKEEEEEEEEHP